MSKIEKAGYTRVTDVLKIFSKYDDVPEDKLAAAAEKGTAIHNWIADHTRYKMGGDFPIGIDDLEDIYQDYGKAYLDWYDMVWQSSIPYALEERFYDDDLMITGQVDLILKKDDKYWIIDYKTSYTKGKDWGLQLAAYAYLVMRNRSNTIEDLSIVHLRKDGTYKLYSYEFAPHIELFMKCLDLYTYFNAKKRDSKEPRSLKEYKPDSKDQPKS